MNPPLTDVEVRILGALLEKEVTTPDNYPLSMSALQSACNQLSNREPVMQLDEGALSEAVVSLRRRSLLRAIQPAGSRVTKYQHLLTEALSLDARERAVLGVLTLRGQQTSGELHARTARLADFADIPALESTLEALMSREGEPLVTRLARRAGQKEVRYAHLLGGEPVVMLEPTDAPTTHVSAIRESDARLDQRVDAMEEELKSLRAEIAELRATFEQFRAQF